MITPRIPNEPFKSWLKRFQLLNDGDRPLAEDLEPAGFPRIFFRSTPETQDLIYAWILENELQETCEFTTAWRNSRLILSSDTEMVMFKLLFSELIGETDK